MINKIYLLILGLIIVLCIYFFGMHSGYQRYKAKIAGQAHNQQSEIIKIQRKANAETVRHSLGDIRNVLRQKYTIAD